MLVITNNPEVVEKFHDRYNVEFIDGGYRDVLVKVRDLVFAGHLLLTHPLMGSIKPNETPYRSVAVEDEITTVDAQSVEFIEDAIAVYDKFAVVVRPDRGINASEEMKADFRMIDLSLISSAIDRP